jgi:hypothetical protein
MIESVTHSETWSPVLVALMEAGVGGPSMAASLLSAIRLSPLAAVSSRRTPTSWGAPVGDWRVQSNASVLESAAHEMVSEPSTPDPVNPPESSGSADPVVNQVRNAPVANV